MDVDEYRRPGKVPPQQVKSFERSLSLVRKAKGIRGTQSSIVIVCNADTEQYRLKKVRMIQTNEVSMVW